MILNRYFILVVVLLMMPQAGFADINNNRPPFSLTLAQVEQWTPTSKWADKNNVSTITLQPRITADLGNNPFPLDAQVKVLIAPDGMNNLANYINEQKQFNLYNFTHWAHIDVLNWFAGTANETISLPAKPWVETAHRNGVKVIGTVYLSVAQYGGDVATVAKLLQQDSQGRFPFAIKLVALADYYGFDGWLINPETDLTQIKNAQGEVVKGKFEYENAARLGKKMQSFMKYLTSIAPKEMEIHWYDSMLLDGSVKWQNELNDNNQPFFQDDSQKSARISDAMFINYWWNGDMVTKSHDYAKQLGRSPYDIYFGADLSPARNAQKIFERSKWLSALFPEKKGKALSSIALFGNDVTYTFTGNKNTPAISNFKTDKKDYRSFYNAQVKLFSGNDHNLYLNDKNSQWPGIGRFVPAKSTLTSLPFSTSFNTGHGLFKAHKGKIVKGEWHDIGQQDILPTWQFAIDGNKNCSVFYNFEHAYLGGSSLAIKRNKSSSSCSIPLYQSRFLLSSTSTIAVTFQYPFAKDGVEIWLETNDNQRISMPLVANSTQWEMTKLVLAKYANKSIERIGFSVNGKETNQVAINIGLLEIN